MGRKSGGNAWNDFQRAHAGEGMTRSEAAAAYRSAGTGGGGGGGGGYESKKSAWNDFQHAYGGRGLSKDDLSRLYAHQKSGDGADKGAAKASGPRAQATATAPGDRVSWNTFQNAYGGKGLTKDQISYLYHEYQTARAAQPRYDPNSVETRPTKNESEKTEPPPLALGTGAFPSAAAKPRNPSPFEMPPTSHRREPEMTEPLMFGRERRAPYVDAADGFSTPPPRHNADPLLQPTASPFGFGGWGFGEPTKRNLFGAHPDPTTGTTTKGGGFFGGAFGAGGFAAATGFGTAAVPMNPPAAVAGGGTGFPSFQSFKTPLATAQETPPTNKSPVSAFGVATPPPAPQAGFPSFTTFKTPLTAPQATPATNGRPTSAFGVAAPPPSPQVAPSTSTDYLRGLYAFGEPAQVPASPFGVRNYKGFEFDQVHPQQPLATPPQDGTLVLDAQYLKHFEDAAGREQSPEEIRAIYKMGKDGVTNARTKKDAKQVRLTSVELPDGTTPLVQSKEERGDATASKDAQQQSDEAGRSPSPPKEEAGGETKVKPTSGSATDDEPSKEMPLDWDSVKHDTYATTSIKKEVDKDDTAPKGDKEVSPRGSTLPPCADNEASLYDDSSVEPPVTIRTLALTLAKDNRLTRGSCSTVYEAKMNDSTLVAVKVVPNVHGRKAIARCEDELSKLRKLPHHPHLLRHYGHVWLHDGNDVGVVSELLTSAQSLRSRLYRSARPLDETAKHRMLLDVLEALVVLHAHDITHRDLSPAHVLLLPDSNAIKLIDYGLPTLKNASATGSSASLGFSPAYASPELIRGQLKSHDIEGWKKSDVLSFTVLLVELLTEEPPWEGELPHTIVKTIDAYATRPYMVENLRVNGVVSPTLEKIVTRGWHENPEKRPTAASLLRKLEDVFS